MDIQYFEVESYIGGTLRIPLASPNNSNHKRLMVLLPGRSYTIDAPLMYYSKILGWQLGYDTLLVNYGFHINHSDFELSDIPNIHRETDNILSQVLNTHEYDEVVFVGKSLGTPIAAMLANKTPNTSKIVLLTPIQRSQDIIDNIPTLAIIGTDDRVYDADMIVDTDTLTWVVYDYLNHGLQKTDDLAASLAILPDIMQHCEAFLSDTN